MIFMLPPFLLLACRVLNSDSQKKQPQYSYTCIDDITACVHSSKDYTAEHGGFMPHDIVTPGKKGGLACINRSSPVSKEGVCAEGLGLASDDPENDKSPPEPRCENHLAVAKRETGPLLGRRDTGDGQSSLFFGEVKRSGCMRCIREQEEAVYRNRDSDQAVNDKQPAPTAQAMFAIHARVNARLDETSNHGPRQTRSREDTAPLSELPLGEPAAEHIVCADKGGRLADALEEADCHDRLGALDRGGDHGEATP
ncbi:hypothetical protein HG530_007541 [Fusarium avenaceum]|nr:hypothetical protein HG530_007541 [Fusarium avenaceum]